MVMRAVVVFLLISALLASAVEEGSLRLEHGGNKGNLEVFHNGRWGAVCSHGFKIEEALVACCQLGFNTKFNVSWKGTSTTLEFWLDDVDCRGDETSLSECSHRPWGSHNCAKNEAVAIFCTDTSAVEKGSLWLEHGGNKGNLEVFHNGTWGAVCDDHFGMEEALVACRQLGFNTYVVNITTATNILVDRKFNLPWKGTSTILELWLDNVNCRGDETSLSECSHRPWGLHNCAKYEAVAIFCTDTLAAEEGSVRLEHGGNKGNLEVFHNGTWGAVCDDHFGMEEALVACRQLGFNTKFNVPLKGTSTTLEFLLDDVKCRGNETSLSECSHRPWGLHTCVKYEAVAILCTDKTYKLYILGGCMTVACLVIISLAIYCAVKKPCVRNGGIARPKTQASNSEGPLVEGDYDDWEPVEDAEGTYMYKEINEDDMHANTAV